MSYNGQPITLTIPSKFPDFVSYGYGVKGNVLDSHSNINHAGSITDVNVWDWSLTTQEMLDWTSCRYNMLV